MKRDKRGQKGQKKGRIDIFAKLKNSFSHVRLKVYSTVPFVPFVPFSLKDFLRGL